MGSSHKHSSAATLSFLSPPGWAGAMRPRSVAWKISHLAEGHATGSHVSRQAQKGRARTLFVADGRQDMGSSRALSSKQLSF